VSKLGNVFAGTGGIVVAGLAIGILAPLLQKAGNPGNMGVCVACFTRDIAGAVGLHRAAPVQYMRPEIVGFVLGALVSSLAFGEFRPRAGSAPIARFVLGVLAMIGALVFLGCPWRMLLRLSAGDANAVLGLLGLGAGIWIATRFLRRGYSLGRAERTYTAVGLLFPVLMLGALALRVFCPPIEAEGAVVRSGPLFYSLKGPGARHAPLGLSVGAGLLIGFLAQRSRYCTMGALRDLFLFRQMHLMWGVLALLVAASVTSLFLGQSRLGFEGQPAAHTVHVWNFGGMLLSGLAFALAGGCPGRQCFMAGEGDGDAAVFVLGMLVGAAVAHNFGLAATPKGVSAGGMIAVGIGLAVCAAIGFTMRERLD
jgi:YedE family putative selenium metabolism protein